MVGHIGGQFTRQSAPILACRAYLVNICQNSQSGHDICIPPMLEACPTQLFFQSALPAFARFRRQLIQASVSLRPGWNGGIRLRSYRDFWCC